MDNLLERLTWVIIQNRGADANIIAEAIVREIETTHSIVDPEIVTDSMLDACFGALPPVFMESKTDRIRTCLLNSGHLHGCEIRVLCSPPIAHVA